MSIEFRCKQCGRMLRTPDETAGQQAKCPACGSIQPIPIPGAVDESRPAGEVSGTEPHVARPPVPPPIGSEPPPPQPGESEGRSPFGETMAYRPEGTPEPLAGGSPFGDPHGAAAPPSGAGTDTENPYQAPADYATEIRPAYQPGATGIQPTRIDISDVLSRAWAIYKARWGMCALVVLILYAISFALGLLISGLSEVVALAAPGPAFMVMNQIALNLVNQLVGLWLNLGMTLFMLNVARGHAPSIGDLFKGGRYLLTAIGATLLMMMIFGSVFLVLVGPGILSLAIGGPNPFPVIVLVVGGVAAGIMLVVIILIISQYMYLIIDRGAGPLECITLSREITAGNRLMIFLLFLVWIPLSFVGLLACCVGSLFTTSFVMLALGVQYLLMTGQPTGDQLWQSSTTP